MRALFIASTLLILSSVAVAEMLEYSLFKDGSCGGMPRKSYVLKGCTDIYASGFSLEATPSASNVGCYRMGLHAAADCTDAAVAMSGVCNKCANGMTALCGGLPGALMIEYNCPAAATGGCGACADTARIPFGKCFQIPNFTPPVPGYVYASVNWGCITACSEAAVSVFPGVAGCSGAGAEASWPIGLCNNGTMLQTMNATL